MNSNQINFQTLNYWEVANKNPQFLHLSVRMLRAAMKLHLQHAPGLLREYPPGKIQLQFPLHHHHHHHPLSGVGSSTIMHCAAADSGAYV